MASFDSNTGNFSSSNFFGAVPRIVTSLVTDGTNLYVAGEYQGTRSTSPVPRTVPHRCDSTARVTDVFVVKINSSLKPLWAERFGSNKTDSVFDLAIDSGGVLYLTGTASSPAGYGTTVPGTIVLGKSDTISKSFAYLLLINGSDGSLASSTRDEGTGGSNGEAVAVDNAGNVVMVGSFTRGPSSEPRP